MNRRTTKRLVVLMTLSASLFLAIGDAKQADAPRRGPGIEMRTDTQGVDFTPYMHSLYLSIKQKWDSMIPAVVAKGESGTVQVQWRVTRDGKVPESTLKTVYNSGNENVNQACLKVIRTAAPFGPLPEAFPGEYIELRITFSVNEHRQSQ